MLPARATNGHSILKIYQSLTELLYNKTQLKKQNVMSLKDMVIFVGGAFSLDMSILY